MHYTVCDYVLDIFQNSLEAGSARTEIVWDESPESLRVSVKDSGRGMSEKEMGAARDPFYTDGIKHRNRKAGLGLSFLEQVLDQSGGKLDIRSAKGKGTEVVMIFNREHIDTPPVGDIVGLFHQALCFDGDYELVVRRLVSGKENYRIIRSELREVLGDLRISENRILLKNYLVSQEREP